MFGCSYGRLFQVTVAGGSYQEGLITHLQGVPPGLVIDESELYAELLQRKPGQGELSSPRREADVPIIYAGVNVADTMTGFHNEGCTNGTPLVILIPNVDRHLEHIEAYRATNRTPRPGHASYATYQKYGEWDDSIGAGIFSGRYTSTICAAGAVARKVLTSFGIDVFSYVREAAGVAMPDMDQADIRRKVAAFRTFRRDTDPVYDYIYRQGRIKPGMRLFEKMAALAEFEKIVPELKRAPYTPAELARLQAEGLHPVLNCPHLETAEAMYRRILEIKDDGDSSGGIVEVVATGVPAGLGEPVFDKLDAEIGRMLGIAAVRAVEVGAGLRVKDMTGSQSNDQMFMRDGKVAFTSNNAGGIAGGVTTGQDIVARLAVKPTPTIAKPQRTIDKVSLEDASLAAVTRRDPTIVSRIWPVAEAFLAVILLDHLMMHMAFQKTMEVTSRRSPQS